MKNDSDNMYSEVYNPITHNAVLKLQEIKKNK